MTQLIPQPNKLQALTGKDAVLHLAEQTAAKLAAEHAENLPDLYIAVKRYETYLKELIRQLRPTVIADARERELGYERINGSIFHLATYTRIDYSADTRWEQLQGEIAYLLDQRRARERQLKARPTGVQEVDKRTGELYTVPSLPREVYYGLRVSL